MIHWRTLGRVLKDAWPVWLFIGGLAGPCVVAYLWACNLSERVSYAGMFLQISGLFTVAFGIKKMRKLFRLPTKVGDWFQNLKSVFKKSGQDVTLRVQDGIVTIDGGEVRPHISAPVGASLERRIEILEENLNRLREELDQRAQRFQDKLTFVERQILEEGDQRQAADKAISLQIEEVAVGGLHLEIVGLWWLILGVVGTSIPNQLAKLISRFL